MSFARNIATVGLATLISRVLGFVRDMLIAALFGTGATADAFLVGFQVINLARRLLAEGSLNSALVPVYLDVRGREGERSAGAFAGRLAGTLALVFTAVAVVGALFMPFVITILAPGFAPGTPRSTVAVNLARLMLPYIAFAGPVAALIGILNANRRFAVAAYATAAFNAILLVVLVLILSKIAGSDGAAAELLALAVGAAGAVQLVMVAAGLRFSRERVAPLRVAFGTDICRFAKLAVPGLIANGMPQITVVAAIVIASSSPGAVSWLYYANRLIELPLGIVGVAIGTVLVPTLVHARQSQDGPAVAAVNARGLELSMGLALPAAIGLACLSQPVVHVLFERGAFTALDASITSATCAVLALGLPGQVLVKALAPAFYASENTATPMLAGLAGLVLMAICAVVLFPAFGDIGIAVAIALSGWATAGLLSVLIGRRIGPVIDTTARRRLPRIVGAALGMGVVIVLAWSFAAPWLAGKSQGAWVAALAALVLVGIGSYAMGLRALGVLAMREIIAVAQRTP